MAWRSIAAALVGLAPFGWFSSRCAPGRARTPAYEPPDPEDTPKGVALAALKEIEFDRETGKLSDEDYAFLKGKYTGVALDALRAEAAERRGGSDRRGRRVRCRGHDRCQGSRASLRCDLGAAGAPSVRPADRDRSRTRCSVRPAATGLLPGGACAGCGAELGPGSRFCEQCGTGVAA